MYPRERVLSIYSNYIRAWFVIVDTHESHNRSILVIVRCEREWHNFLHDAKNLIDFGISICSPTIPIRSSILRRRFTKSLKISSRMYMHDIIEIHHFSLIEAQIPSACYVTCHELHVKTLSLSFSLFFSFASVIHYVIVPSGRRRMRVLPFCRDLLVCEFAGSFIHFDKIQ